jgi:hypothetical protein
MSGVTADVFQTGGHGDEGHRIRHGGRS